MPSEEESVLEQTQNEDAAQREAERVALQAVFEDIRSQSGDSAFVLPARWVQQDFIPAHMDSQAFVDFVFAYVDGAMPAETQPIPCADITYLEGANTMYLYSRDYMTDAYANWLFLAKEDSSTITLVQCAREDSRVYPRPLIYTSLMNPPFNMTEDQILDAWKTVQESGLYPDIQSCSSSNDDVYFYSTDYLSPRYAESLAEFYSVERPLSL